MYKHLFPQKNLYKINYCINIYMDIFLCFINSVR